MQNRVIIITGVAGSGKTTVGKALAEALKLPFYDGDTFHSETNIAKMVSGIPLDDQDRLPWLKTINEHIKVRIPSASLIIACSGLKEKYRQILMEGIETSVVIWVHLQGSYETIYKRMTTRAGHFMNAEMLRSQFDAYETPGYGIMVNINQEVNQIINYLVATMSIPGAGAGVIQHQPNL